MERPRLLRRRVALVVVVATMLVIGACGPGGSSRNGSTTSASSSSSTTSTTAKNATSTVAVFSLGRLLGAWYGHGRGLTVEADGSFELGYRLYKFCDSNPAPCDSLRGNEIVDGGHVAGRFDAGSPPRWTGQITSASEPTAWPVGPISADYDPSTGIVSLQPGTVPSDQAMTFCDSTAEGGACGA
jgi:hypothetical protein